MAQHIYGNNKIFCKGRFISGPDARACAGSFLMILVPSILWQIYVGSFMADRYSVAIPFFTAIFQVIPMGFMLATALSDPGIMPRQKEYNEYFDVRTKSYRNKPPQRYHDLMLRGHPFKLKYCTTCNIYRPPRCTHCSVCENCVERFDHHCPWIGNCIGKRNYWLFFSFVTSTAVLNIFVLATSLLQLGVVTTEFKDDEALGGGEAFAKAMEQEPITTAIAAYCVAIVWFTVGLSLYHSYLVCMNQTTYEQIKGVYTSGSNPFNRGIVGNISDILCGKVRPRYFDPWNGRLIWPKQPQQTDLCSIPFKGDGKAGSEESIVAVRPEAVGAPLKEHEGGENVVDESTNVNQEASPYPAR
mmetsp:Transcript_10107/g.22739  ORF Transcript_10107/g.22739 Transcript_10107/m.22739 type:complete len:357 (-) Transcript_10107:76-1146(-)